MSLLKKVYLLLYFMFQNTLSMEEHNNDISICDMCGIYGYIVGNTINNDYQYIYKYQLNISFNTNSMSLKNIEKIGTIDPPMKLQDYKSFESGTKIFLVDERGIISMYDMNTGVYYPKYVNAPIMVDFDITQACFASDYTNKHIYMVHGMEFYYYSFSLSQWNKGSKLNDNHNQKYCVYGNSKLYIFDETLGTFAEYIDTNENISHNEFNVIKNGLYGYGSFVFSS